MPEQRVEGLVFAWDRDKAEANLRKHGVAFAEAATVFGDALSLTIPDPVHSKDEDRFVTVGTSALGRVVVAVHTEQGDRIRLISARVATSRERKRYEEKG